MDLSNCLFNTFYSLHKKQQQNDGDGDDDYQGSQVVSAISAIKQILQAPLSVETYVRISENILILLKNLCD